MKVGDLIKINMIASGTGLQAARFTRDGQPHSHGGNLGILISNSDAGSHLSSEQYWKILLISGRFLWLFSDEFEVQNESR
jgi:hypothetical protein